MGLHSLTGGIDTSTSNERLIVHMLDAHGQFESELIRERTQAGLAALRAIVRKAWESNEA